jgi:CubicO group peptidase (beta-lactamase class C family)
MCSGKTFSFILQQLESNICIFICRHEAGLTKIMELLEPKDCYKENIKENAIGKVIEAEEQAFPPKEQGTNREYHGVTRGLILNEIFRRVEPQGRTMGEFLREEISGPLGADVQIGANDSELERYSDLIWPGMKGAIVGVMAEAMLPKFMGRRFEPSFLEIIEVLKMFSAGMKPSSEFFFITAGMTYTL